MKDLQTLQINEIIRKHSFRRGKGTIEMAVRDPSVASFSKIQVKGAGLEPEVETLTGCERKSAELGKNPTVAALELGEISSSSWSHRFVIAIDPMVKYSSLLLYGSKFAQLLELPENATPHLPMARQLPKRYSEMFMRGCSEAHMGRAVIRLEGKVEREDGHRELYRAAFIPVGVRENSLTHCAFGAFSRSLAESALAA